METLTKTTQKIILIDAERRQIRYGERKLKIMVGGRYDGMVHSITDEIALDDYMENAITSFDVSKDSKQATTFNGIIVDNLFGFRLYADGTTYSVLGNGYIDSDLRRPDNGDYYGHPDVLFPIEDMIEGTGPVEGKLVIQWI